MAQYQCLNCEQMEDGYDAEPCCSKRELFSVNSMPSTIQTSREGFDEVIGCFRAAEVEGLAQALAETTDLRLKDLVERRLMYALRAAERCKIDVVVY